MTAVCYFYVKFTKKAKLLCPIVPQTMKLRLEFECIMFFIWTYLYLTSFSLSELSQEP